MKKYPLVILCFFVFNFLSCEQNTISDGLVYKEINGNITILYYIGSGGHVEIPAKINGKPVVEIGYSAFDLGGCETKGKGGILTSVIIPNSVTRIGHFAFEENQLTTINIPNSVTYLGGGVFRYNQLNSVKLPNGLNQIGDNLFTGNNLKVIEIPGSVTDIGSGAFEDNILTSVNIPGKVSRIGIAAFSNNFLTSITIGENVTLQVNVNRTVFDNGFDEFYNNNGKKAGIYTRPDTNSIVWIKQE